MLLRLCMGHHGCHLLHRSVSSDVKDKQPLLDARRSIERDMERFKACEKESKIKGINKVHTDPKEKAKEDARDWINSSVDAMTTKVMHRGG